MFKRSGSKTSVASSHKSTPLIRPTYINASMRGANKASSLTMARNSTLEIPTEHVKMLEEMTVTGRVPASTTWETVRDEVCAPLIERLLGIAIACRSDSFLPNGKWIGSGPAPDADGVIKGLGGEGLLGGGGSDDDGDNARNAERKTSGAAAAQSGIEANQQSAGGDGDDGARTPKTAPTTPVADGEGYGSNGSRLGNNGMNGEEADAQRGGASSDQDSDSDNDTAGRNKARRASVASASSSNATVTNPPHDVVPAVLDYSDFEAENEYIMDQWCSLEAPIFTLQRLAEIILQHRRHHCFSTEHPFGAAAIALGGATVDVIGSKAKQSNTTSKQHEEAAVSEEGEGSTLPKSPRSRGVLRGEKLQMAIRRCVLVAALDLV